MPSVVVLGGDGFCGWPTALHLSDAGWDVTIVDNLSRRGIDAHLGISSLTPISTIATRIVAWRLLTDRRIRFVDIDLGSAEGYPRLAELMKEKPDAVVHFAEQRAAPYSMKSMSHRRYTVSNNVGATHHVLCAMLQECPEAHLVHLGTMGVYGYGGTDEPTPEGYVLFGGREVLHPTSPGSVYHMTKCLDQQMFQFYAKNDGLRITDLHQGIVWGTQTEQTRRDDRLINRFDYDGDYGTVLNRFLMQAAVKYSMTVHGTGEQTRAFINVQDTVRCVELALRSPAAPGRVRIMNQFTETHRLIDLAVMISDMTGATYQFVDNPRIEARANDLCAENKSLLSLGLRPITLSDGLMEEIVGIAAKYASRADMSAIPCRSTWSTRR
jgi:UDP-sulfoquinovose synthase